jgi:hypothetical protein
VQHLLICAKASSSASFQGSDLLRKQSEERLVRRSLAVCITPKSPVSHSILLHSCARSILTLGPALRAPTTASIPLPTSSLLNLIRSSRTPLQRIPRQESLHFRRIEASGRRRRYRSRALLSLLLLLRRRRSIARLATLGGALRPDVGRWGFRGLCVGRDVLLLCLLLGRGSRRGGVGAVLGCSRGCC